jgi:hypothetical protein
VIWVLATSCLEARARSCHLQNMCVTALASTSGQTKGTYCMHMKFHCLWTWAHRFCTHMRFCMHILCTDCICTCSSVSPRRRAVCTTAHVCCAVRVFGYVSGIKDLGILHTYTEARKTTAGTRGESWQGGGSAGRRWRRPYWLIRMPQFGRDQPLSVSSPPSTPPPGCLSFILWIASSASLPHSPRSVPSFCPFARAQSLRIGGEDLDPHFTLRL